MTAFGKASVYSKKFHVDECEIVFLRKKITTVRITDSEITEIKQNEKQGFGGRLIHKQKILAFQTDNESEIESMIEKSFRTQTCLKPKKFWKSLPFPCRYETIEKTWDRKLDMISDKQAADVAQIMINSTHDEKINEISGSLNIISEHFEVSNSNSLEVSDNATYISGIINAESTIGTVPVSGIGQECCRTLSGFHAEKIGLDAKEMCIETINPQKCESGTCSVILNPYSMGELLAFVFAPNFNLKLFAEKKSCFSNRFQNKIAFDGFSLVDDPRMSDCVGSKSFDDEGIATSTNSIIDKGIFKNTFTNTFDGFREDKESTGNAIRATSTMGRSAEAIPDAAPHNLRVKEGDLTQDEMIKDTRYGVIVGRLWYTYAVNPIKGDFSCTARSGIKIIEKGEIRNPGKPFRIIHNLPILLQNISQIGNNSKNVIPWASLPSITPSVKIEDIKIISI